MAKKDKALLVLMTLFAVYLVVGTIATWGSRGEPRYNATYPLSATSCVSTPNLDCGVIVDYATTYIYDFPQWSLGTTSNGNYVYKPWDLYAAGGGLALAGLAFITRRKYGK